MAGTCFTERDIKCALDGTFTRLHADGKIATTKVSHDHLPMHVGPEQMHRDELVSEPAPLKSPGERWTDEEDALVIKLVKRRFTYTSIGRKIGRSHSALQNRVHGLRKAGRFN